MQIYTDFQSTESTLVQAGVTSTDESVIFHFQGVPERQIPAVGKVYLVIKDLLEPDDVRAGRIVVLQRQGFPEVLEVQHIGEMTDEVTSFFVEIGVKSDLSGIKEVVFKPADGEQTAVMAPFKSESPRKLIRSLQENNQSIFIVYPQEETPNWGVSFLITMIAKANNVKLNIGDWEEAYKENRKD